MGTSSGKRLNLHSGITSGSNPYVGSEKAGKLLGKIIVNQGKGKSILGLAKTG